MTLPVGAFIVIFIIIFLAGVAFGYWWWHRNDPPGKL
jgi:hypothetical protein